MAQATRLASFGPVFLVSTFLVRISYYEYNYLVSKKKKHKKRKKMTYESPKRHVSRRLGSLSSFLPSLRISRTMNVIYS